jgi:hypothetical protein
MMTNGRVRQAAIAAAISMSILSGCSCVRNALVYYEGAKVGFTAEYKPDSSQPVKAHLGFERRVVTLVPPENPLTEEERDDPDKVSNGDALAVVSTFDVVATATEGVEVHNYVATGRAAAVLTAPSVEAPAPPAPPADRRRGLAARPAPPSPPPPGAAVPGTAAARVGALLEPTTVTWPTP